MMRIVCCALLMGATLNACNLPDCKEYQLLGEEAKAAIRGYDSPLPYTVISVPDSLLATGSRAVEPLLDSLVQMNLLTYSLADTTGRYRYILRWTDSLERFRVKMPADPGMVHIFMGRKFPADMQFDARYYQAGNVAFSDDDSLYVRRSCVWVQYKYSYRIDSLNALGELTGIKRGAKFERAASFAIKPE